MPWTCNPHLKLDTPLTLYLQMNMFLDYVVIYELNMAPSIFDREFTMGTK